TASEDSPAHNATPTSGSSIQAISAGTPWAMASAPTVTVENASAPAATADSAHSRRRAARWMRATSSSTAAAGTVFSPLLQVRGVVCGCGVLLGANGVGVAHQRPVAGPRLSRDGDHPVGGPADAPLHGVVLALAPRQGAQQLADAGDLAGLGLVVTEREEHHVQPAIRADRQVGVGV